MLLVGHQWPYDQDLMALSHGRLNRGQIKSDFIDFAEMLRNARSGPLAQQQGYTIDDLRNAFSQGEIRAREVADKNGTKEYAYSTAYDSMMGLQHDLTTLAEEGNKQIDKIQQSKEPAEAKVPQIIAAVHQYQALSNLAAAKYSGNVLDAMQRILAGEGHGQSARQFAQDHGLDVGRMFKGQNDLEEQVRRQLGEAGSSNPGSTDPPGSAPPQLGASGGGTPTGGPQPASFSTDSAPPQLGAAGGNTPTEQPPQTTFATGSKLPPQVGTPGGPTLPGLRGTPVPSASYSSNAPAPIAPSGPTPSMAAGGAPHLPSTSVSPLTSAAGAPTAPASPVQPVTPGDLMHSFDKGMQAGTPISATAGAVPPPQPPEPQAPPTTPTSGMGSVPVNAPGRGMTMTRTRTICDACRAIAHHRRHHGNLCPRACYG